jgi:hypothetical protein
MAIWTSNAMDVQRQLRNRTSPFFLKKLMAKCSSAHHHAQSATLMSAADFARLHCLDIAERMTAGAVAEH